MKKTACLFKSLIIAALIIIGSGIRFDVPVEKLKAKYANEHSKFVVIGAVMLSYRPAMLNTSIGTSPGRG